jgi:hypothetical protein
VTRQRKPETLSTQSLEPPPVSLQDTHLNRLSSFFGLRLMAAFGFVLCLSMQKASAEEVRSVLELFTSQGCSSCPPADKLARSLADDQRLLVLSLPVDYWDYLGWKDTLAHSAFSKRQKGYALSRGDRQVYTPQIVINGMHHAVGSDREGIMAGTVAAGDLPYLARIEKESGRFMVVLPDASSQLDASVLLLPVLRSHQVEIGRGENRGETVTYINIVRGITELGRWEGKAIRIAVPASAMGGEAGDADSFVVLVQQLRGKSQGAVLAAAKAPGF